VFLAFLPPFALFPPATEAAAETFAWLLPRPPPGAALPRVSSFPAVLCCFECCLFLLALLLLLEVEVFCYCLEPVVPDYYYYLVPLIMPAVISEEAACAKAGAICLTTPSW